MRPRFERPRFDIAKVLEYYGAEVPHHRTGGWQKMKCFLHPDSMPSATVNFHLQRFCCWSGCLDRQTEDAIGIIQHAERCDFRTAVAQAEEITGDSHRPVREA